ncbi:disulfide bond formation protein B [Thalassolituus pacificus]|jgi:disulfide bond formation protein DsbB|uniref:Disulfide bond formation protein B n=1 Tax=Thalassolituus pacificus TaxID=2975440 RepID=A0A9X3ARK7_9GAMM|nr:disulfide bond formation protein B [Thalassolituus pacificus]MCT7359300.1 disulfide bond formation protein B [Thalassolituus pacificus]
MQTFLKSLSLHHGYLAGFLSCVALLAAAYYFEYALYLEPCPLCMVQRLATLAIGLGCLAAFIARQRENKPASWTLRIALIFTLLSAIGGVWVADHHVWLQNLPPEDVPACGPGFDYLIETLPLSELIGVMLRGNGNCADVSWSFVGLTMPEWTRLWFIGYTLAAAFALFRVWPRRR